MANKIFISIVTSFYNSTRFIDSYQKTVQDQEFSKQFEIIMIDDNSTDGSVKKIKKFNLKNLRIFSLPINCGPAKGRNFGIKKAKGDYIFFLDIDDTIEKNTLTLLYNNAVSNKANFVFCDSKWIENSENQRKGIYSYSKDRTIDGADITKVMIDRLYNPRKNPGILSAKGRLIKRSFLVQKKIFFEERLRYLEDEIFNWDVLANVKKIQYVREQLYCYHTHPGTSSGINTSIRFMLNISKFKIIKKHIENSLIARKVSIIKAKKIGSQALIFFIINLLISNSKSMFQKKINYKLGKINQKKIINMILKSKEIEKAITKYSILEGENQLIPKAILFKRKEILYQESHKRAREILYLRKKKMYV
jgi:glycosyltransferase involved in cell wall biosynthesis